MHWQVINWEWSCLVDNKLFIFPIIHFLTFFTAAGVWLNFQSKLSSVLCH